MIACWGLALIFNAQGWVPVGGDWLAADGSSFWSRCGSAMCACGPEAWPVGMEPDEEPIPESTCCAGEDSTPLRVEVHVHDEPASAGSWLSGLGFVALGSHRRQQSEGASLPESLVLELPTAGVTEIDRLLPLSLSTIPVMACVSSRGIDIPVPPPRA